MPEEFQNGGFTLKTHQIFSVHTMPAEEFQNVTITGYYGFVFENNSGRVYHGYRKAGVFKFVRFEECFRKASFSPQISVDGPFLNSSYNPSLQDILSLLPLLTDWRLLDCREFDSQCDVCPLSKQNKQTRVNKNIHELLLEIGNIRVVFGKSRTSSWTISDYFSGKRSKIVADNRHYLKTGSLDKAVREFSLA